MERGVSRLGRGIPAVIALALLAGACGGDGELSGVEAAEARVATAQKGVTDAQSQFDEAKTEFCDSAETFIGAVDRYGKVFDKSAATVGDINTAGADLAKPGAAVESDAKAVVAARDELAEAQQDLTDAEAALESAKAAEAGAPTTERAPATTSTTSTLLPPATVERAQQAQAELTSLAASINESTPLLQATAQFNAAALALEVSWLRVFADAGCFTDDQKAKAQTALQDYTAALQTALQTAGYYTGKVDGVYGPSTVEAVQKLQTANGLPVTGYVDQATAAALSGAVLSKGGAVASQALAYTAAVQSTLKLAGYWTGAVNGQWTPELTVALQNFQKALGVPPSGYVDAATLHALEKAIAEGKESSSSPPSSSEEEATTTTR